MLICERIELKGVDLKYIRVLSSYDFGIKLHMYNTETHESFISKPTFDLICNNDILGLIDNKYLHVVTRIEYQIYKCIENVVTVYTERNFSQSMNFTGFNLVDNLFKRYDYVPNSEESIIFYGTMSTEFSVLYVMYRYLCGITLDLGLSFNSNTNTFELRLSNKKIKYSMSTEFERLKTKLIVLRRC